MAKPLGDFSSWVEVAPAIFIGPRRASGFTQLETIQEEEEVEREDYEESQ
ncbi:hypothetical protein CDL15_Pgr025570 [Punica granatum]|uniref:Uncharacterized protein n=1 Tax=Punica granatum TaxID=22663 RepID=A0A218WBZ6_PUNGR|nr:hypothetical protein CDL15_Pgr025570 [Punica granatum]